jgi:hypothetical protein
MQGWVVSITEGTDDRRVALVVWEYSLVRDGLKVDEQEGTLTVSNTAQAIATILRDTAWANGWSTVLSRLPGAQRTGAVRFSGAGAVSRAIVLKIAEL